jgi:hypothetical protein
MPEKSKTRAKSSKESKMPKPRGKTVEKPVNKKTRQIPEEDDEDLPLSTFSKVTPKQEKTASILPKATPVPPKPPVTVK